MSYTQQGQQVLPTGTVPLCAPYYGAPIGEAARRFFKKYAAFTGRASRSEYWWWFLISSAVTVVLEIVILGGSMGARLGATAPAPGVSIGIALLVMWSLAVLVPSLALVVRRLHDVNFSGWMVLFGLVPLIGGLALLVFMLLPPNPEGRRFDVPAV